MGATADTINWDRYCPKEGLQALDALHDREDQVPGAVLVRVARPQLQRMFVRLAAQPDLDDVGGVVTHGVLPVEEQAAGDNEGCDDQQGDSQRGEFRLPGDDPVDYEARYGEPPDPGAHSDKAEGCGEKDT